jgi:tripartite-type tricarboxylate transporter receptor subunit TctC
MLASSPLGIFARADFPAKNADELAAYIAARAKEGQPVSYASVGFGSFYHLLGEQLSKTVGAPMLHVPYKGGADVLRDLLGGQLDLFITPYGAPHVAMQKQGKIKTIAAMSPQRALLLPDVPSVNESQALKGFNHSIWTGFFVRKDTPEPVVRALNKAIAQALSDPAVRANLDAQGLETAKAQTPQEAGKAYTEGAAVFRGIAKSINLQPQ